MFSFSSLGIWYFNWWLLVWLFSKLSNKITHFQVVAHKGVSDLFQVITHDSVDNLLFVMLLNVTRSDSHWVQICRLYHVWISVKFTIWV